MDRKKTPPADQAGAAVSVSSVDADQDTANKHQTQSIITGWWAAVEDYRSFALHVADVLKANKSAGVSLRTALRDRRLLAREMKLAIGGGK